MSKNWNDIKISKYLKKYNKWDYGEIIALAGLWDTFAFSSQFVNSESSVCAVSDW
jgi:hypothetical protein